MRPICVSCQRFFRCKKNDYPFIEGMPIGDPFEHDALPGTETTDRWTPYRLWFGDRWECGGCGASIVVGVAQIPLAESYQPGFQRTLDHFKPQLQVNDF